MNDNSDARPTPPGHGSIPGVLSGEALRHVLDVELARSRRYETCFVILKAVLDDAGWDDLTCVRLQRQVAAAVRAATRWADTVGRDDDGQVLVILRETNLAGADAVIEKMRTRIAEQSGDAPPVRILKSSWRKGDDLDAMLRRLA